MDGGGSNGDDSGGDARVEPAAATAEAGTKTVGFLAPRRLETLPPDALRQVDALRRAFSSAGYGFGVVTTTAFASEDPEELLGDLQASGVDGWVVRYATAAMQHWFLENRVPVVLAGAGLPYISLPSVEIDLVGACRGAVDYLRARGHRVIALMLPNLGLPEDRLLEDEFGKVAAELRKDGGEGMVLLHDGTVRDICTRTSMLFSSRGRPSAFIVARPMHVLTILTYLARCNLKVPEDVSLISLYDERSVGFLVPDVSRFQLDHDAYASQVVEVLGSLVDGRPLAEDRHVVGVDLFEGESVTVAPRR